MLPTLAFAQIGRRAAHVADEQSIWGRNIREWDVQQDENMSDREEGQLIRFASMYHRWWKLNETNQ